MSSSLDETLGDETHTPREPTAPTRPGVQAAGGDLVLERGTQIGRYVVLSRIGAGGMGVVLAAYDPKLDRRVALKVLRPQGKTSDRQQRLVREAQALAKLSHPNVVAVHDVGTHDDRVFVAMEYVEGQTLTAWLRAHRGGPKVLPVLMAAGRGLEAAHAASLVHRDFKPENVMVGEDGRVRVMDFGLARGGDEDDAPEALPVDPLESGSDVLSTPLTQTGAVLGTPAYMAPEQFAGLAADERSDQFSFCVSLWEGLYGERPFAGETMAAIALAATRGQLREPPAGNDVSARLRRVIERGLRPDPSERHPDMGALLLALEPPRRTAWQRWALPLALAAGGIGFGVSQMGEDEPTAPPPPCAGLEDDLVGVWDGPRRTRVETALRATEVGFAEETTRLVSAELDRWSSQWSHQRKDACEATRVRGEQSDEAMDLRMACLDRQRVALSAAVDLLAEADAALMPNAARVVEALPRVEDCGDLEALRARVPPPADPDAAARVQALEDELARVRTLAAAGRATDAVSGAQEVADGARAVEHPALLASALLELGAAQRDASNYDASETSLEEGYTTALSLGMLHEAADAAAQLTYVVGYAQTRPAEGRTWAMHATALARGSGRPDALGGVYNSVGALEVAAGQNEAALEAYVKATTILEETRGPEHPSVAHGLQNQAMTLRELRRMDEAKAADTRALEIIRAAVGPNHPDVGGVLLGLGGAAYEDGDYAEAERQMKEALEIWETAYGPHSTYVAVALSSLGVVARSDERIEDAKDYQERALPVLEATLGKDHLEYARALVNLGYALSDLEHHDQALARFEEGLQRFEKATSPTHTFLADPLTGIAKTYLATDRPAEAIAPLERAVKLRSEAPDRAALGSSRFALARALWEAPVDAGRDRARARALANEAIAAYREDGKSDERVTRIEAWLAERG